MAAICRVTLIGFLSRDPESDYTPNGTLRIKFSIPVNRRYTDRNGQDQESTAWYNVSVSLNAFCVDWNSRALSITTPTC